MQTVYKLGNISKITIKNQESEKTSNFDESFKRNYHDIVLKNTYLKLMLNILNKRCTHMFYK